jgi:hypothetical protein
MLTFFFLARWQTSVHQLRRDDNFQSLLEAILNAFEFGNEDVLRDIQPSSTQTEILNEMLQRVSECANVIKSYAFTKSFAKTPGQGGTLSWPDLSSPLINMWFSAQRTLNDVKRLRETVVRLRELRENFFTHVAVAAVPELRSDVRTPVTDMSNLASEIGASFW